MATEKLFQDVFQSNFTDLFSDTPNSSPNNPSNPSNPTSSKGKNNPNNQNNNNNPINDIVIDKSALLQQARSSFHDATFIRSYPDECIAILTTILQSFHPSSYVTPTFLAAQAGLSSKKLREQQAILAKTTQSGHTFLTQTEATELFFDTTQLFVSPNLRLRRMTYVVLKELIPLCAASDVIIVISCLTKDMTRHLDTNDSILTTMESSSELQKHETVFRANALRVLVHVLDHNETHGGDGSAKATMLSTMERYIQQAILDYTHHPAVSSSALLCALHWLDQKEGGVDENESASSSYMECALLVKRWIHHVATVLDKSRNEMVCFHALLLYYQMKKLDKVGVVKLVQTYTILNNGTDPSNDRTQSSQRGKTSNTNNNNTSSGPPKLQSIMATVCIIRYITKLIQDELIVYTQQSAKRRKMGYDNGNDDYEYEIVSSIGQTWGYTYLLSCIRQQQPIQEYDSSMLIAYEACRAVCHLLPYLSPHSSYVEDMYRIVMRHLRMMVSSLKPVKRYAAVKTLCLLSSRTTNGASSSTMSSSPDDAPHPHTKYTQMYISKVHIELRSLCNDPNRLVGTYSIITLLQTMQQRVNDTTLAMSSLNDKSLLRVILPFVLDQPLAEEYRVMIINSLKVFCIHAPSSPTVFAIVGFLATCLREGGTIGRNNDNFGFKRVVLQSMVSIMDHRKEAMEASLYHLCEYIEDCDFVHLSTEILHVLGKLGPQTTRPAKYCRFIFNRIMLENSSMIRSAAVFSLAKFGASCPSLTEPILSLLKGQYCMMDSDDEVRDRVVLSVDMLEKIEKDRRKSVIDVVDESKRLLSLDESGAEEEEGENDVVESTPADEFGFQQDATDESHDTTTNCLSYELLQQLPVSFHTLERQLLAYREIPGAMESSDTLTFGILPVIEDEIPDKEANGEENSADAMDMNMDQVYDSASAAAVIYSIPDFASYGKVFNSSSMVSLTEAEAEYVVQCIKHVFEEHVVLQFVVENTIRDQELGNVHVALDYESDKFHTIGEIPAPTIKYETTSNCFTVLKRDTTKDLSPVTISCELKFSVERVDPATGQMLDGGDGWEEEYVLENLEINSSDFVSKAAVMDFRREWRDIGNSNEVLQKFSMQQNLDIDDAIDEVIRSMGMKACDGTDRIQQQSRKLQSHMIHLSGRFLLGTSVVPVLARSQISITPDATILKLAVRSENIEVSKLMADCIS